MHLNLVADVLDEQIVDSKRRQAGRVDGIVLELRADRPPRLAYIEISPITLLSRFNRRLAHWYARHDRKLGEGRGVPVRIPWSRLTRDGPGFVMVVGRARPSALDRVAQAVHHPLEELLGLGAWNQDAAVDGEGGNA